MTSYRAGLARRGDKLEVEVWVFDLPGCCAIGRSEDEVHSLLPLVTAEHQTWLVGHGIESKHKASIDIDIVERLNLQGSEEYCFSEDGAAADADEIERIIQRMELARRDLLGVVRSLPDVILDWRPPAASVSVDAWEPGGAHDSGNSGPHRDDGRLL